MNRAHAAWRSRRALLDADGDHDPEVGAEYAETRLAISIAQMIYDQRTARGWTQQQLADEAGMHPSEIARLENTLTLPSTRTLQRVAQTLASAGDVGV